MTERESTDVNYDKVDTSLDGGRECKECGKSIREKEIKCPRCGCTNLQKGEP